MAVAKDQNGCRFLQRKFDEGGAAAIQAVLPEVLEHLIELMMDPFGNYLIQKLLDRCSEEQRLAVRSIAPSLIDALTLANGWVSVRYLSATNNVCRGCFPCAGAEEGCRKEGAGPGGPEHSWDARCSEAD